MVEVCIAGYLETFSQIAKNNLWYFSPKLIIVSCDGICSLCASFLLLGEVYSFAIVFIVFFNIY